MLATCLSEVAGLGMSNEVLQHWDAVSRRDVFTELPFFKIILTFVNILFGALGRFILWC